MHLFRATPYSLLGERRGIPITFAREENICMKNTLLFTAIASVVLATSSCTTDVDLNADYKSTTFIFGLLDAAADTQWVKINRTYLGEGNNLEYAQIRDSIEYKWEDFESIVVEEIVNDDVARTFELQEKEIANKELNGVFYAPEQKVYFFPTPENGLNETATYRITVKFVNLPTVTAETQLVQTSTLAFRQPIPGLDGGPAIGTLGMVTSFVGNNIIYKENTLVKWTKPGGAAAYNCNLIFHYSDVTAAGETIEHTIDYNLGSPSEDNVGVGGDISLYFNGEGFFAFLQNQIPSNPDVLKRVVGYFDGSVTRCFDLRLSIANEEYKRYVDANSPVTGVIQERPTYSNIAGGIGLFASRTVIELKDIPLKNTSGSGTSNNNMYALANSSYTSALNFCDPTPGSTFACD